MKRDIYFIWYIRNYHIDIWFSLKKLFNLVKETDNSRGIMYIKLSPSIKIVRL